VLQTLGLGVRDIEDILRTAVDRLDADLLVRLADDAEHAIGPGVEALDEARLPAVGPALELAQEPVAHARGGPRLAAAVGDQQGAGGVVRGLDEADVDFAVDVAFDHVGDADRGQVAGGGEALAAALAEFPLGLEFADHLAQGAAVAALEAEVAGDVGLLGGALLAQEGEEGVTIGEAGG